MRIHGAVEITESMLLASAWWRLHLLSEPLTPKSVLTDTIPPHLMGVHFRWHVPKQEVHILEVERDGFLFNRPASNEKNKGQQDNQGCPGTNIPQDCSERSTMTSMEHARKY